MAVTYILDMPNLNTFIEPQEETLEETENDILDHISNTFIAIRTDDNDNDDYRPPI